LPEQAAGRFVRMFLSKSFGYALRSILYLVLAHDENKRIQLSEIAGKLNIPRHFLGKVMKRLAKEGVLLSQKGPMGGFIINGQTLQTPLIKIAMITGESAHFDSCVLRLKKCNSQQPCPLHQQALQIRDKWLDLLSSVTVSDLYKKDQADFIKSIANI